ncbi:hypothetical protein [Glaciecola petra]|uniref:Uncharacterized protein n=1 Tax=Glaciecola petra TaxID=3075602 RepID=A0ABU2ZSW4_9ALTE|nr:hypothetical protein [Aestuariibacter sp. P117]MDT0595723.1 hypothetical protein [Aestuariibacter sp. P117]
MKKHNRKWMILLLLIILAGGVSLAATQISLDSPASLPSDI